MSERESLFLGVDGGGTRCRARLCNAHGEVLGEGLAGPANIRFGVAQSFEAVLEAARQCYKEAELALDQLKNTTACLGLAGATEPVYLAAARSFQHPFRTIIITTDAQAACAGAHGRDDGGIIIAGTGSIGWAQIGGNQYQVGGWGFPLSDEGSGAWLGCEVLRRVLWAHDGRMEWSPLLRTIFAAFERDPQAIVRWMTVATPRDFGRLTHEIVERAAQEDPVGSELMVLAAGHIDKLAARLRSLGVVRIVLFGGLAESILPWLAPETRECLVEPKGDAVQGALEIAMASERASAPVA